MSELLAGDTLLIRSTLVDPETGDPITGASVSVDVTGAQEVSPSVTEKADGIFEATLDGSADGPYYVRATASKNGRFDVQQVAVVLTEHAATSGQQTLGQSAGIQHQLEVLQAPLNDTQPAATGTIAGALDLDFSESDHSITAAAIQ